MERQTDSADALRTENAELRTRLDVMRKKYDTLVKAYNEVDADFRLLMEYKKRQESRVGRINTAHNEEIVRLQEAHRGQDVLTAIFSAMGGFGACAVVVWAIAMFA